MMCLLDIDILLDQHDAIYPKKSKISSLHSTVVKLYVITPREILYFLLWSGFYNDVHASGIYAFAIIHTLKNRKCIK